MSPASSSSTVSVDSPLIPKFNRFRASIRTHRSEDQVFTGDTPRTLIVQVAWRTLITDTGVPLCVLVTLSSSRPVEPRASSWMSDRGGPL